MGKNRGIHFLESGEERGLAIVITKVHELGYQFSSALGSVFFFLVENVIGFGSSWCMCTVSFDSDSDSGTKFSSGWIQVL